jgi:DNA-binding winged helix-turn-helix (wHTH) protein
VSPPDADPRLRFGPFELDGEGGQLRRHGVPVRLPPQPFKLLLLLVRHPGKVITRDEIRRELWGEETFVDFDQGVNFSVRQIREALGDAAERPLYVETVPRRGYRFIAPVESIGAVAPAVVPVRGTDIRLQKALWTNIAELRQNEARRRRQTRLAWILLVALVALALVMLR